MGYNGGPRLTRKGDLGWAGRVLVLDIGASGEVSCSAGVVVAGAVLEALVAELAAADVAVKGISAWNEEGLASVAPLEFHLVLPVAGAITDVGIVVTHFVRDGASLDLQTGSNGRRRDREAAVDRTGCSAFLRGRGRWWKGRPVTRGRRRGGAGQNKTGGWG